MSEPGKSDVSANILAALKKIREGKPDPDNEKKRALYVARVREVIHQWIGSLGERLSGFEVTCHGHTILNGLESFIKDLRECYANPSSYTISNLTQAARQLSDPKWGKHDV